MTELTESQRKAFEAARARRLQKEAEVAAVPTERMRTMLGQGLLFGAGDEIEAAVTAPFSDQTYGEKLDEVRGKVKAYQEARPWEALGYEAGGAAIPALLAAPFTGGTSTASLARLGVIGAIEGGAYAFNTGEGGFANRAARAPGGAILGGIAGPAVGKAAPYVSAPFVAVVDAARRRLGGRGAKIVETELARLVEQSGKTVDELVEDVANGRLMVENATLRDALRAYRASGGPAATLMRDTLEARPKQTQQAAMTEIQRYLSDATDDNIVRSVRRSDEAFAQETRKAYAPFKTAQAPQEVQRELITAIQRVPGAADELNKAMLAETGGQQFLRVTPPANGIGPAKVEFAREPTMYEAELVRRTVKNYADGLYANKQGTAGEAVKGVEQGLRAALDGSSDALRQTRAGVATFKTAREQFDAGQKAFGKSADQIEVDFEYVMAKGDDAVKAFRAGVMDALRNRATTGRNVSLMRTLADPDSKEGKILRTIFPQDQLEEVLKVIDTAANARAASNSILGGSQTAITEAQLQRQGMALTQEDISGVLSADPIALAQTTGKILRSFAPQLTDGQRMQIMRVLVSEDPNFVQNALRDQTSLALLQGKVEALAEGIARGTRGAAVSQTSQVGGLLSQGVLTGQ